jgi:hypothetical protein
MKNHLFLISSESLKVAKVFLIYHIASIISAIFRINGVQELSDSIPYPKRVKDKDTRLRLKIKD